MGMTPHPLPVNITDRTRALINLDGDDKNVTGDATLADVPVERAQPLRSRPCPGHTEAPTTTQARGNLSPSQLHGYLPRQFHASTG